MVEFEASPPMLIESPDWVVGELKLSVGEGDIERLVVGSAVLDGEIVFGESVGPEMRPISKPTQKISSTRQIPAENLAASFALAFFVYCPQKPSAKATKKRSNWKIFSLVIAFP